MRRLQLAAIDIYRVAHRLKRIKTYTRRQNNIGRRYLHILAEHIQNPVRVGYPEIKILKYAKRADVTDD